MPDLIDLLDRLTSAAARFTRAEMRAAYHAEFIAPQETPHA